MCKQETTSYCCFWAFQGKLCRYIGCLSCKLQFEFYIVGPMAKSCLLPSQISQQTLAIMIIQPFRCMLDPVNPIAGPLSGRLQSILEADEQTESAVEVIRQMTEALLWGEQNVSCHGIFWCWGLNSHDFRTKNDGYQPNSRGLLYPFIRIPYVRWDDHPQYRDLIDQMAKLKVSRD